MRGRLRRWRNTSGRRGRRGHPRRNGDRRRCCTDRSSWCGRGRWCHGNFGRNHDHRGRAVRGRYRCRRHQSRSGRRRRRNFDRGLGRRCLRRRHGSARSFYLRFCRRRRNRRLDYPARRGMLGCFLQLRDSAQYVSRSRNMREVDLGLDLFFAVSGTRSSRRTRRCVGAAAEMSPHQFGFVIF